MISRTTTTRLASLATLTATAALASAGEAPPIFGDWYYLVPDNIRDPAFSNNEDRCAAIWESVIYDNESTYVPVNQPGGGHGGPTYEGGNWLSDYAVCVANTLDDMQAPIALLIRSRNCPFPYGPREEFYQPEVVADALEALPKLDYLLMDLEVGEHDPDGALLKRNIEEIVHLIRSHPNPRINQAHIGNYNDWPGNSDQAGIWPTVRARESISLPDGSSWDRNAFYHQYMDVAMPIAYPAEVFSRHSDPTVQGENLTPNDRAAIFWGPLERVSVAARNLPEDHTLVPWVTNYLSHNGETHVYHAPPPSEEDLRALMQHYRMRGAKSFMVWTNDSRRTAHPTIDYQEFRELAIDAWRELDGFFAGSGEVEYLNLETDKKSGLQWSGVRKGSTATFLVSNLHHDRALAAMLPAIAGLPNQTDPVPPGEHRVFTYELEPAARDYNDDGQIDTGDFITFISAVQTGVGNESRTVGGKGVKPTDVDTNGVIDLRDLIAVASALRDGRFNAPRNNTNTNEKRSFASAPTRSRVGTK